MNYDIIVQTLISLWNFDIIVAQASRCFTETNTFGWCKYTFNALMGLKKWKKQQEERYVTLKLSIPFLGISQRSQLFHRVAKSDVQDHIATLRLHANQMLRIDEKSSLRQYSFKRGLVFPNTVPDFIWNPNKVNSRYTPCIYHVYSERRYIPGISQVYTMDI